MHMLQNPVTRLDASIRSPNLYGFLISTPTQAYRRGQKPLLETSDQSRKSAYDTGGDGPSDGYRMDTYLHGTPENVNRQPVNAERPSLSSKMTAMKGQKPQRVSTCFGMFMVNQTVQKKDGSPLGGLCPIGHGCNIFISYPALLLHMSIVNAVASSSL